MCMHFFWHPLYTTSGSVSSSKEKQMGTVLVASSFEWPYIYKALSLAFSKHYVSVIIIVLAFGDESFELLLHFYYIVTWRCLRYVRLLNWLPLCYFFLSSWCTWCSPLGLLSSRRSFSMTALTQVQLWPLQNYSCSLSSLRLALWLWRWNECGLKSDKPARV